MKNDGVLQNVRFERPMVEHIRKWGFHPVDMHFHTNHSDAYTKVRSALSLAKKKGVGLAITDHNTPSGAVEAHRMRPEVLLIPGMEVSAEDGPHILLYFYDIAEMVEFYEREVEGKKGKSPYMATALPTVDLLECSDRYNCVRAAAHPYGYLVFNKGVAKCIEKQYFAEETLSRFEAIEVINGGMRRNLNRKASNLAVRKGLGLVGGTDGHTLKDLGNIVTCAESADVEGFLNAVVHRQSFVVGREKNLLDKSVTAALLMTRYVPYTVPSIAVHYRQNMPRVQRFVQRRTSRRPKTRAKVK